ncbi:MAG: hypothetical protein ACFFFT_08015 [Candidatus Thorarchaeota archaeon]
MQIFEVIERLEFPFMETKEVIEGALVGDIISDVSDGKVFLLVDHDTKRIWTYNGPQSSLRTQIYGGILAGMLRQQLKLFYRIYPLNMHSQEDKEFQEVMNKQLGPGRANAIEEKDFSKKSLDKYVMDTSIQNPHLKKAIDYINQFPQPKDLSRRYMIIGGQIFADEEITEAFLKEEIKSIRPVKLGQLNNGFTLFKDQNYSTRLIIKDRKIQGIELYIKKDDEVSPLKLKVPLIYEEKYNKQGSLEDLIKAFKIPDQLPEEIMEVESSKKEENSTKDDSINQS